MAKKAKKRLRTAAERSGAAKASWKMRRLRSANLPTPVVAAEVQPPNTGRIVREGNQVVAAFAINGAVLRVPVTDEGLVGLIKDAVSLLR